MTRAMFAYRNTFASKFIALLVLALCVEAVHAASPAVKLSSVGSDTLGGVMTRLARVFNQQYPDVVMQVQANGSSTAPPALQEGTASLGPMSRRMSPAEKLRFWQEYGYDVTEVVIGVDAVAVFVHWQNPLVQLSLEQVDAVFSATRRCGADQAINYWSELSAESFDKQKITTFGRNSASGTYSYFRQVALCGGDFDTGVGEQPGSSSVVQSVGSSVRGIGYSGVGYQSPLVKILAISADENSKAYMPEPEASLKGDYPLARPLYLYVNQAAASPLRGAERDFVDLVLSGRGQEVIKRSGFIPLPEDVRTKIRIELGL